jgi:GNAT superfamily N-acetyltransferase
MYLDKVFDTPELYAKLIKLTFTGYSGMRTEMKWLKQLHQQRKINAKAIVAFDDQKPIAWALLSKENIGNPTYRFNKNSSLFEIYVKQSYRRQGIGSKILKRAKRTSLNNPIAVVPWDYVSQNFYDRNRTNQMYDVYY